jgi:hypothetical protein
MNDIDKLRKTLKNVPNVETNEVDLRKDTCSCNLNTIEAPFTWQENKNTLLLITIQSEEENENDVLATISVFRKNRRPTDRPRQVYGPIHDSEVNHIMVCNKELKERVGDNLGYSVEEICKKFLSKTDKNIREVLYSKPPEGNNAREVWIYCDVAEIDPIWEWLCTKNSKGENCFWGEEFHIIRIPKGCDTSECRVNKKIIILANDNDAHSRRFARKLRSTLQKAGVNDSDLKVIALPKDEVDFSDACIILYAAGNDESIRGRYEFSLKEILGLGKKILFFNLYPLGPLRMNRLPATWIDSQFDNIKEEITLTFVNYFFKAYKNLLKERTNVRVTEILAKTHEMMDGKNSLWRLACVVNGNPNLTFTV